MLRGIFNRNAQNSSTYHRHRANHCSVVSLRTRRLASSVWSRLVPLGHFPAGALLRLVHPLPPYSSLIGCIADCTAGIWHHQQSPLPHSQACACAHTTNIIAYNAYNCIVADSGLLEAQPHGWAAAGGRARAVLDAPHHLGPHHYVRAPGCPPPRILRMHSHAVYLRDELRYLGFGLGFSFYCRLDETVRKSDLNAA